MPSGHERRLKAARPERETPRIFAITPEVAAVRRRRLIALAVLAAAAALAVLLVSNSGGSGSSQPAASGPAPPQAQPAPRRLKVSSAPWSLPSPVSGETVVSSGGRLLVIGGLDEAGASTDSILRLDPADGKSAPFGSLSQPLHDLASASIPGGVLAFGGGSLSTTSDVQRLSPGGQAKVVGHLPDPSSDLSAVSAGGTAYVLGGYDGQTTVASVLGTRDGAHLAPVARLPVPVRYGAVALAGRKIYVIGGELATGQDSTAIQAVDLGSGTASVAGRLPDSLAHASAVSLGGRTYVLGGRLAGQTSDRIFRLHPGAGRVSAAGRLPAPVQNAAAASVGGAGYLVGGLDPAGAPLSTVMELRLRGP